MWVKNCYNSLVNLNNVREIYIYNDGNVAKVMADDIKLQAFYGEHDECFKSALTYITNLERLMTENGHTII